jgi:hypothetical protein
MISSASLLKSPSSDFSKAGPWGLVISFLDRPIFTSLHMISILHLLFFPHHDAQFICIDAQPPYRPIFHIPDETRDRDADSASSSF